MKRWLFNILTALSLLLCVALVAMWVRSFSVHEGMWCSSGGTRLLIHSHRGSLAFVAYDLGSGITFPTFSYGQWDDPPLLWELELQSIPSRFHGLGFDTGRCSGGVQWLVRMPYWFLWLLTSLIPAAAGLSGWRRKRQRRVGHGAVPCPKCRYDLRAHKLGDCCPECGTPIPASPPFHKPT